MEPRKQSHGSDLLPLSYLVHLSPVGGHLTEYVKDSDSVAGFELPPNRSPCIRRKW